MEVTKLEAKPTLPQEPQVAMAAMTPAQPCFVRETVERVMAEMGAMIDATVEAIKSDGTPVSTSGP